MSASELAARYGRTRESRRRRLILAIGLGGAILIVFAAWAIWVGLFQPTASVDYTTVGNTAVGSDQIRVRWELSIDPGKTASCAVQALDSTFGTAGWKILDIPASDQRSRTLSTLVRTSQPAVSGLIYRCWLT